MRSCNRCAHTEVELIEKIVLQQETLTPEETIEVETNSMIYDEIYHAYSANELRASEEYKNNRYQVTGEVNHISAGVLYELTGEVVLIIECRVDSKRVVLFAEFEKTEQERIKELNVGDTITFEGKCISESHWEECIIMD